MKKTEAVLQAAGRSSTATGSVVVRPGFTAIMPWKVRDGGPGHHLALRRLCVMGRARTGCIQTRCQPQIWPACVAAASIGNKACRDAQLGV